MKLEGHPGHLQLILNWGHQEPRGAFFPLPTVSRVLRTLWDPDAICLREVGYGVMPNHGPFPPRKEATDLDVVKGGLVGDVIEQQQC